MPDTARETDAFRHLQEEWTRQILRGTRAMELILNPAEPKVGQTPRVEVYRKGKARLCRYQSSRKHPVPVLMVPNLGISRPYIFDLQPGASFIEYMTREGFDFYLLDWGVFGEEDNGLTVDDCVTRILPRVVRKVLESSGAEALSLLGYCMGGPLSACFVALHPEVPVRALVNMAGPIDFAHAGLFRLWLDKRFFNVDRMVDTLGAVPAEMVKAGFKLLKPTMDVTTALNLWWNLWNDRYVEGFKALNKWANEYVPFPGEFFRQWVKEFYQENRLVRKELRLGGRLVDLGQIRCPVLVVGAQEDYIAPAPCVRAVLDHVGSQDTRYEELPGGHISLIAGRSAALHCWPRVAGWLAPRSG
ncbi:MAG: alpha/beta fold hydrolase [Candidatus Rokubacteria bacterium]|nr:alpha/beta fold hydrolase [Candidatus Rokubacteria bacterium]